MNESDDWRRKNDPKITKDLLIELYNNQGYTLKRIIKEYGHTIGWYHTRFKEYGIEERPFKNKNTPESNKYKIGQKIGNWTIIGGPIYIDTPKRKTKKVVGYICKCICGKEKSLTLNAISGSTGCGCVRNNKRFKGYKDLTGTFIGTYLNRKDRSSIKMESNVTPQYLYELLEKQDFKCAISGIPISLYTREDVRKSNGKKNLSCTASLDRIDSSKGYIIGNVQWVHKYINIMKMDLKEEELKYLCKKVVENLSARELDKEEIQDLITRKFDRNKKT